MARVNVVMSASSAKEGLQAVPSEGGRRLVLLLGRVGTEYMDTLVSKAAHAARDRNLRAVFLTGEPLTLDHVQSRKPAAFDLAAGPETRGILVGPLGDQVGSDAVEAYCQRFAAWPVCGLGLPWRSRARMAVDNRYGMREAVEHLVTAHGHRRIAFVRGPELNSEAEVRYRAYRQVLAEHGIALDPDLVAPGDFERVSGAEAVGLLLDRRRADFTALVCANNEMAFGAFDALRAHWIAVPEQVSVVAFDDLEHSRQKWAATTTTFHPRTTATG